MCVCVCVNHFSHLSRIQLFAPLWTVAQQLLCPWDSPDKNTGVGCHALLHGIFPTQGSNPHLLHWQADSLLLSHQESSMFSLGVSQQLEGNKHAGFPFSPLYHSPFLQVPATL